MLNFEFCLRGIVCSLHLPLEPFSFHSIEHREDNNRSNQTTETHYLNIEKVLAFPFQHVNISIDTIRT